MALRKRRQRINRETRHCGPREFLCAGHILLVQPRPPWERVIGDDVLLDEAADGYADSGLHVLNLETVAERPQRSHYPSFRAPATRTATTTRFSAAGGSPGVV